MKDAVRRQVWQKPNDQRRLMPRDHDGPVQLHLPGQTGAAEAGEGGKNETGYHLARFHLTRGGSSHRTHTHQDFAEVFWVVEGQGMHHVNGRQCPLGEGDLCFVRVEDAHRCRPIDDAGCTLINLAVNGLLLADLRSRYADELRFWPWSVGEVAELPFHLTLDETQQRRLMAWAEQLAGEGESRVALHRFMLNLLDMVSRKIARRAQHPPPGWLLAALQRFERPEMLRAGIRGLVRQTGRTPEHVNRVIRRCYGKTTTQLINDMRLSHAIRELRLSDRSVGDIAVDCGLGNGTSFYRLFQARYGTTPRRFRQRERLMMP